MSKLSKLLRKLTSSNPLGVLVDALLKDWLDEKIANKIAMLARQYKRDLSDVKYTEGYADGVSDAANYLTRELKQLF